MPNGGKCHTDEDCASGVCDGASDKQCTGRCTAPITNGRACDTDTDCQSGRCLCHICRETSYTVPKGEKCQKDSDCQSNNCDGDLESYCSGRCMDTKDVVIHCQPERGAQAPTDTCEEGQNMICTCKFILLYYFQIRRCKLRSMFYS